MKTKLYSLIPCLVVLSASTAYADSPDEAILRDVFENHFEDQYRAGQCGQNVLAYFGEIAKQTEGLDCLYLITVENRGFSVFGMVNAEVARGVRFDRPVAEEANWYYHAFGMDSRGLVYDFDFTTEPSIVPMRDYLEKMFLNEPECEKSVRDEFCAGRTYKLEDYEFTVTSAQDALDRVRDTSRTVRMQDAHADWRGLVSPMCL